MTTYFTPVGTLTELTRAKGSDVNARESAVTAGFTALEANIAVASGKASITYGTNWADNASETTLKKTLGTLVVLGVAVIATGAPGVFQMTLPSGYRPAATVDGLAGIFYDVSANQYYPAYCSIFTNGNVSIIGLGPSGTIAAASGDAAYLNATFFTA